MAVYLAILSTNVDEGRFGLQYSENLAERFLGKINFNEIFFIKNKKIFFGGTKNYCAAVDVLENLYVLQTGLNLVCNIAR